MASKIAGLLKWCKVQCEGYKHVSLTNFTSSWKSGLAFCAIVHRYRPDLIDYESLPPNDTYGNSKLAFDAALSLGIPALLDPEDMVQMTVPDKLCIITYVSQYYNYFHGKPADGGPSVKMPVKRPSSSVQTSRPEKKPVPMNEVQPSKRGTLDDKCLKCKKKVYLLERQIDRGKLYHRHCFRELGRISTLERNKGTEKLLEASRRLKSSTDSRESSVISKIEPNSVKSSISKAPISASPKSQTGWGNLSMKSNSTPTTITDNKSTIASKETSEPSDAIKSKIRFQKEPKAGHQLGFVLQSTDSTFRQDVPVVTSKTIVSNDNEIKSKPAIYTSISKLENKSSSNATSFSVAKFPTSVSPLPAVRGVTSADRDPKNSHKVASPKTSEFSLFSSVLMSPQKLKDKGNESQKSGSKKDGILNVPIKSATSETPSRSGSKCDVQCRIDEKSFGDVQNEDVPKQQKQENLEKSLNQPNLQNWKTSATEGVFQGNVSSDKIEKVVGVSNKEVDLKGLKVSRVKFWRYTNVAKRRVSAEESLSEAEIASKLKKLDGNLVEVEDEGRKLEEVIRGSEENMEQEEQMMKEWLHLVKRRSELIREESELIYQRKQQILEKHHEELEYQYRFLVNIPENAKNDEEKKIEAEILLEILKIVELRNEIIESIETDRIRYVEEDEQYEKFLADPKLNKKKSKSSTGKKWFKKKKVI